MVLICTITVSFVAAESTLADRLFHALERGQDGEHDACVARHVGGGPGAARAPLHQRLHLLGDQVVDDERMPGLEQHRGHRAPQETDSHYTDCLCHARAYWQCLHGGKSRP